MNGISVVDSRLHIPGMDTTTNGKSGIKVEKKGSFSGIEVMINDKTHYLNLSSAAQFAQRNKVSNSFYTTIALRLSCMTPAERGSFLLGTSKAILPVQNAGMEVIHEGKSVLVKPIDLDNFASRIQMTPQEKEELSRELEQMTPTERGAKLKEMSEDRIIFRGQLKIEEAEGSQAPQSIFTAKRVAAVGVAVLGIAVAATLIQYPEMLTSAQETISNLVFSAPQEEPTSYLKQAYNMLPSWMQVI